MKILIAEKSARIRNIIIEIIGIAGNEFAECCNKSEALDIYQRFKPDIAIVDFELIEMNRLTLKKIFTKSNNIVISEYSERK